jgi:hypothetical protein
MLCTAPHSDWKWVVYILGVLCLCVTGTSSFTCLGYKCQRTFGNVWWHYWLSHWWCYCIQWVEARAAAKHSVEHRSGPCNTDASRSNSATENLGYSQTLPSEGRTGHFTLLMAVQSVIPGPKVIFKLVSLINQIRQVTDQILFHFSIVDTAKKAELIDFWNPLSFLVQVFVFMERSLKCFAFEAIYYF